MLKRRPMVWIAIVLLGVVTLAVGGLVISSWRPPELGTVEGRLRNCPESPNCICSQQSAADAEHHIEPLALRGNAEAEFLRLASLLAARERTRIVTQSEDYLRVEFATKWLRFVDDAEFLLDRQAGVIHVRSASRVGKSDLGMNRQRMEEIRANFSHD